MIGLLAGIGDADRELFVRLNQWLHGHDYAAVDAAFRFLNQLGSACTLLVIVPLVILLAPNERTRRRHVTELAATVVAAIGIVRLIKLLVSRDRPQRALRALFESGDVQNAFGETASKNSFPSGHTALVVALMVLFWLWCCRAHPKWKQRAMLAVGCVIAAGAALGRVYTGMHFPLDLVGGAVVGVACAYLGAYLGARIWREDRGHRSGPS